MKRPLRTRVWFYKPTLHWWGWKGLRPVWFGDDEYHWKTMVIGWNPTGQIIIALWPFRNCDKAGCWEDLPWMDDYPGWPVRIYDHQLMRQYGNMFKPQKQKKAPQSQ